MLPFYGRGVDRYEGDKRKRGGSKNALVAVAAVLGVALIVTSWGAWSSRSAVATAKRDLAKLRNEVKEAEEDLQRTIDTYRHVEGSFHAINRDVLDKTRQLRQKEEELASFRTEKEAKISDCQRKQDEVFDQLAYETEVNDALKRHIHSLEEAHKLRETDWHGLAEKWRKYEEDTINENHRLQTEIRKLQHIEGDARFDDPALPVIEPEDRPEAHWDANFHVPEYHKGEYHHSQQQQQQQQASQQQAPQQQQQQQHQAQQHQQHQQQQQHHQQPVPSNPSAVPVHPQPPSHPDGLRHHDDIYAHHYEDHAWGHDDPLDHYWMHDGFADGHDAFHGDNWHHPASPHTDEWRAEDHGRVEAHGGWSSPDHAEHGGHHYEDWRAQDGHGGHGAQGAHGGHHDEWRAPEHGQRHDGSHGGHGQDWNNEWHAPDHTLSRDQHGGDRQWRDEPRRDMRRDEVHDDHWKDARRQEPPRRTLEQAQAQGQGHAADMHAQGRDQQHREGRWDDRRPGDRGVDPRQAGGTPQYHPRDDEYRPGSVPVRRKSHDDLAYKLGF